MSAIFAHDLVKHFSPDIKAVDGIDLDIPEGQVFGFLGQNGSGKTTTVRMFTTLLRRPPHSEGRRDRCPRDPDASGGCSAWRCRRRLAYSTAANTVLQPPLGISSAEAKTRRPVPKSSPSPTRPTSGQDVFRGTRRLTSPALVHDRESSSSRADDRPRPGQATLSGDTWELNHEA